MASVTAPKGFKANGIACGIKKSRKKDLMLIFSQEPCVATGVFTSNKVKASCVNFNIKQLKKFKAQAIIANSGNANCLTGQKGVLDTRDMAKLVSRQLGVSMGNILVASTGIIGESLPMAKIRKAIPSLVQKLSSSAGAATAAAEAILTTDRVVKQGVKRIRIGSKVVTVGMTAKGAGMIHPNMTVDGKKHATMLAFFTTDAKIDAKTLTLALQRSVSNSFNMISIDADQSTNDMVLVLANGCANNKAIKANTPEFNKFCEALKGLCIEGATSMIKDAEGATKFIEINIQDAKNYDEARQVGLHIASSKLVKTALFGSDPNWGRIAASAGASSGALNPNKLKIKLGPYLVLNGDEGVQYQKSRLNKYFKKKNITMTISLGTGSFNARLWTSDLSVGYVKFNSAYTT